jgi:predicted dehydrogenase
MGGSWRRSIEKHPDWDLIGIVDTNTEMLENVENMGIGLNEDQAYMSIEDAVQYGEKPDLAVIATPIYSHSSLVREVMGLGINVMSEKNMASTIYQGRQMVQEEINHPELLTGVGTQYRYGTGPWTGKQFFLQNDKPDSELDIGKLGMIRWEDAGYRGESRWGWRRFLQEIYLEDMSVHWFDTIRYITGMDIVQVKADTFMPRYSDWHGSSEVFAQLALAAPDDYNHRHNWVWVQLYGGWQRRGPTSQSFDFYGAKGQAKQSQWGMECKLYTDPKNTTKFEDDGYMPQQDIENLGTDYMGHGIMLEQYKRGIEDKGKTQCGTHFKEAFKSFSVAMAAMESSRTGKTVWVPDYWKDMDLE